MGLYLKNCDGGCGCVCCSVNVVYWELDPVCEYCGVGTLENPTATRYKGEETIDDVCPTGRSCGNVGNWRWPVNSPAEKAAVKPGQCDYTSPEQVSGRGCYICQPCSLACWIDVEDNYPGRPTYNSLCDDPESVCGPDECPFVVRAEWHTAESCVDYWVGYKCAEECPFPCPPDPCASIPWPCYCPADPNGYRNEYPFPEWYQLYRPCGDAPPCCNASSYNAGLCALVFDFKCIPAAKQPDRYCTEEENAMVGEPCGEGLPCLSSGTWQKLEQQQELRDSCDRLYTIFTCELVCRGQTQTGDCLPPAEGGDPASCYCNLSSCSMAEIQLVCSDPTHPCFAGFNCACLIASGDIIIPE